MEPYAAQPAMPRKWYEIWKDVLTHPGVETFRSILQEPGVKLSRAFIWVAVTYFITYLVYTLAVSIVQPGTNLFGDYGDLPDISSTTYWVCITIASPFLGIIGLAIQGGIYHGIARLFGGQGTWEKLVYCFAAITAPISFASMLISALMIVLSAGQPWLTTCASLIVLPLGIYALVLYVNAIEAVENIGTGKAVLTYFIPVIVVVILSVCAVVFLSSILISNTNF